MLGGRRAHQQLRPLPGRSTAATRRIAGTATSRSATASSTDFDGCSSCSTAALEARHLPFERRAVFIDLETTGLSGGAGTVAFLVGCGYFDLGAFQVRQFLLTSYSAERALLAAVAELLRRRRSDRHLQRQDLRRAGDGDALGVPSHARAARRDAALRHAASGAAAVADALGAARRRRLPVDDAGAGAAEPAAGRGCRRLRDSRPLLPVPAHRRSAAARAGARAQPARSRVARRGDQPGAAARGGGRGRRAATASRRWRSAVCSSAAVRWIGRRPATGAPAKRPAFETRAEALYRLGLRCRRERRFEEAAGWWRALVDADRRSGAAARPGARQPPAVRHRSARHSSRAPRPRSARARASWRCSRWRKTTGSPRADGHAPPAGAARSKARQKTKRPALFSELGACRPG